MTSFMHAATGGHTDAMESLVEARAGHHGALTALPPANRGLTPTQPPKATPNPNTKPEA